MTLSFDLPLKCPLRVDPAAFRPDPHAGFAKYRPLAGVIEFGGGLPVVTRHRDVAALMTDPRTRQIETEPLALRGITSGRLHDFYANTMLLANPPVHAPRRRPAARAFALKVIEAWRPRIRALVSQLIDAIDEDDEFDFVEAIASPLPSRLIAQIIGAPEEDAPRFAPLVYGMSRGLGAFRPDDYSTIEESASALVEYVERLIADRRRTPGDDFLTDYLQRVDEAAQLSELETLIQIVSIILAGSDTTRSALTMLVSLLLQHREQWEAVVSDPGRAAGAVLEGLRFEPPVGAMGRVVTEPIEIDGIPFPAGTALSLSILSAQRDDAVYAEPQQFNIARTDHPRWSVSFGLGIHRCLGEALACAELEEALTAITQRMPSLELRGHPPAAKGHAGIRGVTPMRVGLSRKPQ
jgi:cytochrome P450 family 103